MTTRREFAFAAAAAAQGAGLFAQKRAAAIRKAMESVIGAIPKAEADPERPVYHFRPPAYWNNDPNGTIFYKGWHHLFYQHNPFGAVWGHMHWGHARSQDLVNWEHLPIALWPSVEKGEEHVFSGAAIPGPEGRPRLFYTSIGQRDPEQWMAIPADDELIAWSKAPDNPMLTGKLHGSRKVYEWRDPFLFREAGRTFMVCGGNSNAQAGGGGEVHLYESHGRLGEWKYIGPVFEYRERTVVNIECPNLFKLGSKWVLLISPHRPCEYFIGTFDPDRGKFSPDSHGILDAGTSYASNISTDEKGRTILWLWGRTATNPDRGWNSVMVMPRILAIGPDGYLRQTPAPEFQNLRGEVSSVPATPLTARPLPVGSGDCLEIEAEFTAEKAAGFGLRLRGTQIAYNAGSGNLTVGATTTMLGRCKTVRLHVFLDKRVVEVYANDGAVALFTTVDASSRNLQVEAFAQGGSARLESLRMWPMKPARFSLDRYRV